MRLLACTAPTYLASMTFYEVQTDFRSLPKTARVSFSSNVPRTKLSYWLQLICQSKCPYSQTLHPETLSWGKVVSPTQLCLEPYPNVAIKRPLHPKEKY
jgi:hypothetical protein